MTDFLKNGITEGVEHSPATLDEIMLTSDNVQALIENLKTFDLDDNKIQILYRYSSSVVNLMTFTLIDDCDVCIYSSGYIAWTDGGSSSVLSHALYRTFTETSYGSATTSSISGNGYFSSSYAKILSGDMTNVLYCNADIYGADKETLLRKADAPLRLADGEIVITDITNEPAYIGDDTVAFNVETVMGDGVELDEITYEYLDVELPFAEYGRYTVQVTASTTVGTTATKLYSFTVYPDRCIPYPTDVGLPPEDGHADVAVLKNAETLYCVTSDFIAEPLAYFFDGSRIRTAMSNGISVNSTLYKYSDRKKVWEEIPPATAEYFNRIYSYHQVGVTGEVLYSTTDFYDSSTLENLVYPKDLAIPRAKYDFNTMQVAPIIECANPRSFDASVEGFITMRLTKDATTVYSFCFRGVNGNKTINATFEPTAISTMDNVEMCILSWNTSSGAWSYYKTWGAVNTYALSSTRGNLYYLTQEIDNVNIYLSTKNRTSSRLLYEVERVREPIPLHFLLGNDFVQVAGDVMSDVKVFDGEYWHGVELTDEETGAKIFINGEWKNIGLF